jgi:hypothetical protein
MILTEKERQLLDNLAAEGRATTVYADELKMAHALEGQGLIFLVADSLGRDAASPIITPMGRRLLAKEETKPKRGKPAVELARVG